MGKVFFLFVIFYSFLLYGQDEIRVNNPPPPKNLNEIATYNVDDNIVFYKIEKLSNSFDFSIFEKDIVPSEILLFFLLL